ncbi:MAG: translation initiation factor IF-2 [Lachnospiraceae bacterium]|nr:translation initiation factor IF-2 [Lachnospiraceae bacterium]
MAKIKVHELAKELDKQSKDVLSFLQKKGIEAKVAQSSIEEEAAEMVRRELGGSGAGKETAGGTGAEKSAPAAAAEKAETKAPEAGAKAEKAETKAPEAGAKAEKAETKAPEAGAKAEKAETKAPEAGAKAEKPETGAPNVGTRSAQAEKPGMPRKNKPDSRANEDAQKKKKSKIIFVSNPQNSKMSGQGRPQGGQNRQNNGYNDRNRAQGPVRPIKPLTPPSPTPSVQMVSSKPAQQSRQNGQRPGMGHEAEKAQNRSERQERPERPERQERPVRDNRGSQEGRRDGRPQGGNSQGGRPERGQYQSRGGAGSNGRPQGDRQNGFQRNGRPGPEGGRGDRRGPGAGAGGNRNFNGSPRDNRGSGGQGAGSRDSRGGKGFAGEAPAKDMEKRRDDDKRRANNQERDKRSRKDHIYEEDEAARNKPGRFIKPEKKKEEKVEEVIKVITLPEMITIKDLADKMKLQPSAIVKKLFLEGKIVTVNQEISYEDAENIAMEYDILCEKEVKVDIIEELLKEEEDAEDSLVERPPVICVMGHVDHGKTSLLDSIRKTNVTDKEAGGITQHIGAYTVNVKDRKITFLDTPGHEAFTAMRMRGANSTDIAILVVAADDGVMPQTIEAINHAKAAGIEIIVAVNKIDKPSANIDRVKQELTEYELIPVDWGGTTEFVPVSAKTGEGIENLLETILLTADILELKANPDRRARGLVIEAELDKGRGPVATVLVQKGTLHVGDFISAGSCHGKVRAMIDDKGRRVKEATPSTPVEILGLSDVPSAGEVFLAHDNDKTAKNYAETYLAQNKEKMLEDTKTKMSLDDLFSQIQEGNLKELCLIVKADVQGSVEAVKQSLMKLTNEEVVVKCIHGGVGAINESDVVLASASNAIIIGFNVRLDPTAKATAEREGVDIRLYKVIYQAIEDIEAAMKGMLDPVFEEKIIGHAEVRQIFKASAIGNIAGSYVLDGVFQRGCKIRITREGEQIYEGGLASLKRFKDDVKEVKAGFECGLVFEGYDQMQELDIVEAYVMVEVPR